MLSAASVPAAYLAFISNFGLLFCNSQHIYVSFLTTNSFLHNLKPSMLQNTLAIFIPAASPAQLRRLEGKT